MQLLYTRRIGRQPEALLLADNERLVSAEVPSAILGAAKFVGRPVAGLTVASLSALTGAQHVGVEGADGSAVERLADPATFFQALRVRHDLGEHASIGVMATAVKRFEESTPAAMTSSSSASRRFNDEYVG